MTQFKMYASIQFYDTLRAFLEDQTLDDRDLILVNRSIYEAFVQPLSPACPVLLTNRFGSGEPTTDRVDAIRAELPDQLRRIIAIGGGTVLDIAKMLSLRTSSGKTEDLFLSAELPVRTCAVWAIPATCGTGSEVTSACAVELVSLHTKRGLSSDLLYPENAVLIPELLHGLPYRFFATSSVDALIHAVESFLSPKATPHSSLFSREAIRMILEGYRTVLANGKESWTDLADSFLLASNYAGLAFSSAGCAAVHALSYPLGGGYHIPHGEANQLVFAPTFRKYKELQPVGRINELEDLLADCLDVPPAEALEAAFTLLDQVQPRKPLKSYGISREEFPAFAHGVMEGQQRLLHNSYVPLTEQDMVDIYSAAY